MNILTAFTFFLVQDFQVKVLFSKINLKFLSCFYTMKQSQWNGWLETFDI